MRVAETHPADQVQIHLLLRTTNVQGKCHTYQCHVLDLSDAARIALFLVRVHNLVPCATLKAQIYDSILRFTCVMDLTFQKITVVDDPCMV